MQARPRLAAELLRRGIVTESETLELRRAIGSDGVSALLREPKLRGSLFAAELGNADRLFASRAVLRGLLSCDELKALDIILKFQPRSVHMDKLDELIRVVERALERGDHGIAR